MTPLDFLDETEEAAASMPDPRHATIIASVASDGRHREVLDWDGRSAKGPLPCQEGSGGQVRTIKKWFMIFSIANGVKCPEVADTPFDGDPIAAKTLHFRRRPMK
jgi:hypothetical protein